MSNTLEECLKTWVEVFMHRSMHTFILYAKESGLSMSQINALFHIQRKGASGVSDIGEDLGVTSAAASQMLERLVQQNLVLRNEDPHDRRLKSIVLTERGQQILRDSIHARQRWLKNLAEAVDPADRPQVQAALQILIEKTNLLEGPACENHELREPLQAVHKE